MRLRSVQLGYTFPQKWFKGAKQHASVYIKAEKLGIVNNNWNDDDLRKLATSDEYINNCMNYRKYLPTEYKAEQFLKVKGLI